MAKNLDAGGEKRQQMLAKEKQNVIARGQFIELYS